MEIPKEMEAKKNERLILKRIIYDLVDTKHVLSLEGCGFKGKPC
jgi:hypothetical protein